MIDTGLKKAVLASAISAVVLLSTGCSTNDSDNAPSPESVRASLYQSMDQYQSEMNKIDTYGFSIDDKAMADKAKLVQTIIQSLDSLDRSVLTEQDQIFMDMFRFDLDTELKGYQIGGLDRNVIAQIPITHFRNYVESKIASVFATHTPVNRAYRSSINDFRNKVEDSHRIDDYFSGFTNQEGNRDLEHLQSHRLTSTGAQMQRSVSLYRSASDPLAYYRNKLAYNQAYLAYVKEVTNQFKKGVDDGNTLAKLLVDRLVAQFKPHITSNGNELKELASVTAAVDGIATDNESDAQFKAEYQQLMSSISEAVVELTQYLETDYKSRTFDDPATGAVDASIPHGWGGMHDGKDWYSWLLRTHSTTDRSADQIHETGLAEVDRVFGEMVDVCYTVGKCASDDPGQARNSGEIYQFFDDLNQEKYFYLNPHHHGDGVVEGDNHSAEWWAMWDYDNNPNKLDKAYFSDLSQYPEDEFNKVKDKLTDEQLAGYKEHRRSLKEYYILKITRCLSNGLQRKPFLPLITVLCPMILPTRPMEG